MSKQKLLVTTPWQLVCWLLFCAFGFSACSSNLAHLGMQTEEEPIEVSDSDKEAVTHSQRLGWEIEKADRETQGLRDSSLPWYNELLSKANEEVRAQRKSIRDFSDEKWQEYRRLNGRDAERYPRFPTKCLSCGREYEMNRDAFHFVSNTLWCEEYTYEGTSYKWFMWAKWDHHRYISRQELAYCLNCRIDECRDMTSLKWELNWRERQVSRYQKYVDEGKQKFDNLSRSLVKDTYAKKVLDNQSARKLYHKREVIKGERNKERLDKERIELIEQANKLRQDMRKQAAMCLLRVGKSVQEVVQASGLTMEEVANLQDNP